VEALWNEARHGNFSVKPPAEFIFCDIQVIIHLQAKIVATSGSSGPIAEPYLR
jgi:hypothetical protein